MRILITGFSGFIGNYLIKKLNDLNYDLILCDLSNGIDICNWEEVRNFKDINLVIHLANLSFVPASWQEPKKFYEVNYLSTLNILELCRIQNAKLIYFSSYTYGNPHYQPIDEKHPLQAYNPYSQTKIICENLCEGYNRDFNVPITIFRPFNIYGSGQNPDFLIPTIIKQAKSGKIIIKDERPKRDFVHINDVIEAILASIFKINTASTFQIYNLGTGKSHSVKNIIDVICQIYAHPIEYQCTNEIRQNEVLDTIADISKIKIELDWDPKISLYEGLKSMIEEL